MAMNMNNMNMQQVMQQARKMQEQLASAQDDLKDAEVSASAGGGMVKVTASGDGMLTSITIDPDALDPEDVELIQDTILAAVNEALASAQELADSKLGALTGGLNIPGLF